MKWGSDGGSYVPFKRPHRQAAGRPGARQPHEVTATNVTGEQRRTNLIWKRHKLSHYLLDMHKKKRKYISKRTHGPPGHGAPCQEITSNRPTIGSRHGLKHKATISTRPCASQSGKLTKLFALHLTQMPTPITVTKYPTMTTMSAGLLMTTLTDVVFSMASPRPGDRFLSNWILFAALVCPWFWTETQKYCSRLYL